MVLSSGRPDPTLFAPSASVGLRGHWCESYDARGVATRSGRYWEVGTDGRTRTEANYIASRFEGPVTSYHDNGAVFMRGFLAAGEWHGKYELFDEQGALWFEANFQAGRLDGLVRTLHADGNLESEARFKKGREDGLARSFYPSAAGGRLKSEARIEADAFVGVHRVFGRTGELTRSIDWSTSRVSWRSQAQMESPPSRPSAVSGPLSQGSSART